jgi:hypothetical protein
MKNKEAAANENANMAEEELVALGNVYCFKTRLLHALSYPKLRTPHYNENGAQIFTSPITMIFFFGLILCMIGMSIRSVVPMFSNEIINTEFNRVYLTNSLGYQGN